MSNSIITRELRRHVQQHRRLERFLAQGQKRANLRSAKAAVDEKARAIVGRYNLRGTQFSGINKVKRAFRLTQHNDTVQERLTSRRGIPLAHFGAKQTRRAVTFSVRRGKRSTLRSGFGPNIARLGGRVFTREGRSRLPINQRFGPGLATMAANKRVRRRGDERYLRRIVRELRKEETNALRRAGM